jgi:hypothetical protein
MMSTIEHLLAWLLIWQNDMIRISFKRLCGGLEFTNQDTLFPRDTIHMYMAKTAKLIREDLQSINQRSWDHFQRTKFN